MESKQYHTAVEQFQKAIEIKPDDRRRVYTNGMNWIHLYFPNREQGIAYYELGNYEKAQHALTTSLKMFPTSKAEYYLNKSRVKLARFIEREKSPPVITHRLKQYNDNEYLELTVDDDTFVETILLNEKTMAWLSVITVEDAQIAIQSAKPQVKLTIALDRTKLKSLVIQAQDIFSNKQELDLSYYLDSSPPTIFLTATKRNEFQQWVVRGLVFDNLSNLTQLTFNDKPVKLDETNSYEFELEFANPIFLVNATDQNENRLKLEMDLRQSLHPSLMLKDQLGPITQQELILVRGQVEHAQMAQYVYINDRPVKIAADNTFTTSLPLQAGHSQVHLQVVSGNSTVEQIHSVVRVPVEDRFPEHRLSMTLAPFKCDLASRDWCNTSPEQALFAAIRQKGRFEIQPQQTVAEHLRQSRSCDIGLSSNCELSDLQMKASDTKLLTAVYRTGGGEAQSLEAFADLILLSTGQQIIQFDAYQPGDSELSINQQLFLHIHEKFPRLSSTHTNKQGKQLIYGSFAHTQLLWTKMPVAVHDGESVCSFGSLIEIAPQGALAKVIDNCKKSQEGELYLFTL